MKNKTHIFRFKIKDLGEGILEAVVASSTKDRQGEIVDIKGLDIKKYMKNPVVLWAHDYSTPPIGKTLSLRKSADGKLIAKMQFAIDEDSFAHKIYKLYKGGYLKAFSIGFIPQEMDGDTYTKSEMLEYSAVPVPANAEALALAMQKGIITNDELLVFGNKKSQKGDQMLVLKDILAKRPEDLTAEERAFLIEKADELSDAQKTVFKDILPEVKEEKEEKKDEVLELKQSVESLTKAFDEMVKAKDINSAPAFNKGVTAETKEDKFKLWYKGLVTRDFGEYQEVTKDAMNTTDDGDILPPEEFIAEVSRLEEEYGVAARYANVRRGTRPTMRGIKGGDDVEFVKTSEGGVKPSKKVSYNPYELTYLKYAAIVPVTDELLEDSAINLWNDIAGRFARAAALREDQLVFTENDIVADVYGVVNADDTARIGIGDLEDLDADHLNEMLYAVPTPSMTRGRYYLHRTVLGAIQRIKATDGHYIWKPGVDGSASGTIWGYPYTLTEVLPSLSEIEEDTPFMVFGDLKNTILGIRIPMQVKYFDTGSVVDPDDDTASLNLLTQDVQAVRARIRMNQIHVHPEAYSVLTTGDLS